MDDRLFSASSGYFSVASGVAVLNHPFVNATAITFDEFPENKSQSDIDAELLKRHELSHYRQLMSTPLGLLLWRTYNSLISDLSFVSIALQDIRPTVKVSLPIHQWVTANPIAKLAENGSQFAVDRSSNWKDLGKCAPYIHKICEEIGDLTAFLDAFLYNRCKTVGEFVDLANKVFIALCKRSDLPAVAPWRTNLPANSEFGSRFSCTELIEAGARLTERSYLEGLPESEKRIAAWEPRAIRGVYERAYEYLLKSLGDANAALCVLDVAFMSPIDPAFAGVSENGLVVEDVLPSFTISRLCDAAVEEFWPVSDDELHIFLGTSLAQKAGLTTPIDVAGHGVECVYNGENSWGFDHRLRELPNIFSPVHIAKHTETEVRRAMKLRFENSTTLIDEKRNSDGGYDIRPLITFYTDKVVYGFKDYSGIEIGQFISISAYEKFMTDIIWLSFFTGSYNEKEFGRLHEIMTGNWFHSLANDDSSFSKEEVDATLTFKIGQVLEVRRRVLGDEQPNPLTSVIKPAPTPNAHRDLPSERDLSKRLIGVEGQTSGDDDADTPTSLEKLAAVLQTQGDLLYDQGNLAGAHDFQKRSMEMRRRLFGGEHPDTLTSMNNLALTLYAQGDLLRARQLLETAVEVQHRVLGDDHPNTLASMYNLAETLQLQGHLLYEQGDLTGARGLLEMALELYRRVLGDEHSETLISMKMLIDTLYAQGDLIATRRLLEQKLEVLRRALGDEHPDTLTLLNNLAATMHAQGDLIGARVLQEKTLGVQRRVLGDRHPDTITSAWNLGRTLRDLREESAWERLRRDYLEWMLSAPAATLSTRQIEMCRVLAESCEATQPVGYWKRCKAAFKRRRGVE